MIGRREVISLLGGAAAWPKEAYAQQTRPFVFRSRAQVEGRRAQLVAQAIADR
jgi:hypothetical protein